MAMIAARAVQRLVEDSRRQCAAFKPAVAMSVGSVRAFQLPTAEMPDGEA
jgi:hypothetical protein